MTREQSLNTRTPHWLVAAAIAALILGAMLSRVIEPGVRAEKIMLTPNTPALRIFPATPGPHPIALLAHGNGGSKEMLFRFGEALAAAGFDCYSVDQAGYGESPRSCSPPANYGDLGKKVLLKEHSALPRKPKMKMIMPKKSKRR